MPPSPARPDKAALRRQLRAARAAFVASLAGAERHALEEKLAEAIGPLLGEASTVALYSATRDEVGLGPLEAVLERQGLRAAYPWQARREEDFLFRLGPLGAAGPFGVRQPANDAPHVVPDLILVPLLGVDGRGTRLGQGGGHYDRALAALGKNRPRLVGIGWAMQRLDMAIPRDDWDVPLDAFASPDGLETFA